MQAAVKNSKENIIIEHRKKPEIAQDELLIKVEYCGVCGSDLHAYKDSKGYEFVPNPIILGHEISGIVMNYGNSDLSYLQGEKVCIEAMQYCGQCENCLKERHSICENNRVIGLHYDGGMAQYVKTKAKYVKVLPSSLPTSIAVMSEPMGTAIHAVNKVNIKKNDTVFIQGPGIIGFFVGLVCKQLGAKVYISGLKVEKETRLLAAKKFGMHPIIAEEGFPSIKVDVSFECSGSAQAFHNCFAKLKKGGKIVVVAMYEQTINLYITELNRNEWPILTTYGCDPVDYQMAFSILDKYKGKLKNIVDYYSINNTNRAFKEGLQKKVFKPILEVN